MEAVWVFEPRVFQRVNSLFFPAIPAELMAAEEIALLYMTLISGMLLACPKHSDRGWCCVLCVLLRWKLAAMSLTISQFHCRDYCRVCNTGMKIPAFLLFVFSFHFPSCVFFFAGFYNPEGHKIRKVMLGKHPFEDFLISQCLSCMKISYLSPGWCLSARGVRTWISILL